MPVNASHAYARGCIFFEKKSFLPSFFLRVLADWCEANRAQLVWKTFKKNALIGSDCCLGPNAWCVNYGSPDNIKFGSRVYFRGLLRCGARGAGRVVIGDDVYIGDDSIISSENSVEIGQLTMISHGVQIFDSTGHPTDPYLRERDWKVVTGQIPGPRPEVSSIPIKIGRRVWVGFNSIIMRGVTIGDNAIVAAGSVVVNDVEANTIVAGNPAREVKKIVD